MTNKLEYPGYNDLMDQIRLTWDWHDPYGSVQEWRFAIAEVLYFDYSEYTMGYRPAPGATEADEDSYAVEAIHESTADVADMRSIQAVLDRYHDRVVLAGRNY